MSLGVFQRLLNHQLIIYNDYMKVLGFLYALKDNTEDSVQIKIIQTILLMLNPKTIDFSAKEIIERVISF